MTTVDRGSAGGGSAGRGSIGWGIAGCGWVARDHALPGLLATDGARVVALHDRDPAAMARMPVETATRSTDLAEFLATPGLDAVYVASPNHAHRPLVEAAAAAGKAVLCEKPLAADVPDAEAVVAACERAGVLLGTAFDQRFHPAHVRLRALLPRLGTVTAVRIVYCCWLPADWTPDGLPHDNWRVDPARAGGGAAIDLAPHGLDLVGVLLGEDVSTLHAVLQQRVHDYPAGADDGALLAGSTPGGVLVSLHVAYNTPDELPRRRLEVVGTAGHAVAVDTMGQTAGGSLTWSAPEPTDVPFGDGDPFAAQLAAFTAAVAGRAPWPYPAARDLGLHRLLLDALGSAAPASAPRTGVPS
ncbi:gfo/Idh/MocA family oxidoreductase [Modestobacter sp. I12A-02628]|uniref:Gfo/Idh/MocA family oxidoreductase n=1 Tax=Goekera deserti TaxID=2497753 RepID=A0A7K3WCS1_9ACTN|nr:Gfo/Idh/MocA family oxidoreductase [Goekera deserti]MPQ96989.1 gfo/Idh/MocA family oxidoreductase [Goekera deserti]NDI46696.1 Gfo/Idh/MocA family oxidoreductase [Goekera deserti]NEL54265.1 Gfo/Idh/MocA family oxidoreductase [Goekera deserti]